MPTMVAYCETLAAAVGAPFLRGDFFVGSSKWGVRLNEVAYGCGCDYRNRNSWELSRNFDDAPAMARILQEGMGLCQAQLPARDFLSKLGVKGNDYADMDVLPLRRPLTPRVAVPRAKDDDLVIPEELCETPPWPSSETLPNPPPAITPPNPPRASQVSDSRAQRSPHQPPVVIDALRSPAGPRSRSLELQSESFSRPSSP